MDLIQGLLKEHAGDLVGELVGKAGFSTDQAEQFLPEAGSSVFSALKDQAGGLDADDLASQANVASIMGGIDIAGLAGKVGISQDMGAKGLTAMLPMLLGLLSKKGGGAGGVLGMLKAAGGVDDALDTLKGLGGGLFG